VECISRTTQQQQEGPAAAAAAAAAVPLLLLLLRYAACRLLLLLLLLHCLVKAVDVGMHKGVWLEVGQAHGHKGLVVPAQLTAARQHVDTSGEVPPLWAWPQASPTWPSYTLKHIFSVFIY
jgi:hypothetical protein